MVCFVFFCFLLSFLVYCFNVGFGAIMIFGFFGGFIHPRGFHAPPLSLSLPDTFRKGCASVRVYVSTSLPLYVCMYVCMCGWMDVYMCTCVGG